MLNYRAPPLLLFAPTGGGRSDGSGEDDDGDEGNDEDVGEEAGEGALAGANSTAVGASAAAVTPAAASVAAPVTGAAGDGSAAAAAAGAAALVHAGVPGLQRLWSYFTPLVDGMNVSGMDWNKSYRDLLAVGYGPYDLTTSFSGRGLVALWAITNPEYPQAILRTRDNVGVTSVAFSTAHPNLLAAGLYDGSVCVWDTRQLLVGTQDGALPAMVSDQLLPGAHSEAVWGVKWVQKNELGEVLVSISTDGRVTQWDTKKGLVPTPIMTLKRARAPPAEGSALAAPKAAGGSDAGGTAAPAVAPAALEALGATGSEGLLSRTASGLTIDFVKEDPSQYFVGAIAEPHIWERRLRWRGCGPHFVACLVSRRRHRGRACRAVQHELQRAVPQHASGTRWPGVALAAVALPFARPPDRLCRLDRAAVEPQREGLCSSRPGTPVRLKRRIVSERLCRLRSPSPSRTRWIPSEIQASQRRGRVLW